jgi:hypothetical protein
MHWPASTFHVARMVRAWRLLSVPAPALDGALDDAFSGSDNRCLNSLIIADLQGIFEAAFDP